MVKDLSRLVSRQYNNHCHKKYFCQYCLHCTTSEEVLKKYLERFKLHWVQIIKLLGADDKKGHDKVKFTKTEYQLRLPFVIYVDFKNVLLKQEHYYQNPSPPNTSIRHPVGATSMWNAVMGDTLNHPKWKWGMMLLKSFWTRSWL